MKERITEINSDKGKSIGQKEVEQMKGIREMTKEERKKSKQKLKKEETQDESGYPSGT